ncbi:hypothetical protein ACE3MZ_13095 [Paenibacillus sp. WLX1005]|uniref:hypothetical protein n=1 Tax=Paenibacillus sp. WLX1005 TaxID=3243766 RepID=UPI0039840AB6
MERKILEFYEEKVSSKGVVISKMKFIHALSNVAIFIFMGIFAVLIVAWIFYQCNPENYLLLIVSVIVYIVIAIVGLLSTIKIYRYKAARILKNEGVLRVNPTNWSGQVFEEWQFYKVRDKLIEEDILDPKNVERLIINLKGRLPKIQKIFFVLLSATLAAFIPNFTLYLMYIL